MFTNFGANFDWDGNFVVWEGCLLKLPLCNAGRRFPNVASDAHPDAHHYFRCQRCMFAAVMLDTKEEQAVFVCRNPACKHAHCRWGRRLLGRHTQYKVFREMKEIGESSDISIFAQLQKVRAHMG